MGEVGVVGGRRRIGSEVFHLVAMFLEPGLELFLHLESGVVGGDGYEFGHLRRRGTGDGGREVVYRTYFSDQSLGRLDRALSLVSRHPSPVSFSGATAATSLRVLQ